jgi:hypothetical protein
MTFPRAQVVSRFLAIALATIPALALAQTSTTTTAIPTYVITPARLVNLAVRSTLAANESLITGFVVSDPSTATVLVRAAGPALTRFGVTGAMANPRLQIIDTAGRVIADNDDWSPQVPATSAENPAYSIQHASEMVGAFPLPTSSRDAAVVVTLAPGAYTLVISGSTSAEAGVVLGEIYHLPVAEPLSVALARGDKPSSKIVNLSARGRIADSGMILGFVVGGGATPLPLLPTIGSTTERPSKRFLIRVIGPALGGFGVPGAIGDPVLELAGTNGTVIQTNDNWDSDPAAAATIREASAEVGAFPLASGSRDAAVVARLAEGAYTVVARGLNGTTGNSLIEIYELEN